VIFIRYVLFAAAGGASNLASQEATLPALPLIDSVLVSTGVGFVVKYVLDKRWIFLDEFGEHAAEVRKIVWHLWQTTVAKYAGAVVGLSLGNWVKYLLDKHYVLGSAT
jgi:putative flippase GtrA